MLKQSDNRFTRRITISPENSKMKDLEEENGLARFGALSKSDIGAGQNFDAHPPESSEESESSGSNNSLRTSQMVV